MEEISLAEGYERVGKSVFPSVKRPKRANRRVYGFDNVEKISWFCRIFIYFKDSAFTAVKRLQRSKLGM